jgi:hypothetical protein
VWRDAAPCLALGAAATIALAACSPCENQIAQETRSGSGMRAVVFQRNCGATTGFTTQMSILRAGESLPNESGNAIVLDGKKMIDEVRWEADGKLFVRLKAGAKSHLREVRVEGVDIAYLPPFKKPAVDCYVVEAGPMEAFVKQEQTEWLASYRVAFPSEKRNFKFWIEPDVEDAWAEEGRIYSIELRPDVSSRMHGDPRRVARKDVQFVRRLDVLPQGDHALHEYACREQ